MILHTSAAVNMSSKWCCVLAVVCLSVMLLSLDADAQPTTDDITSCSASTLEEVVNMVKPIASNLQRNIEEIVKRQLAECGCASAKSTTVNPIDYITQSPHGTSCLVLIIVNRPTEYHANEIGSLTLATCLSADVLSNTVDALCRRCLK